MTTKTLRLSGHAPDWQWETELRKLGTEYKEVRNHGSLSVLYSRGCEPHLRGREPRWGDAMRINRGRHNATAYSYDAPIAVRLGTQWLVFDFAYNHSVTTSRHTNKILRSTNAIVVKRPEQLAFYDVEDQQLAETASVLWLDGMDPAEALAAARILNAEETK